MERGLNPIRWLFVCWAAGAAWALPAQEPMQAFLMADAPRIVIGSPLQLTFQVRLPADHRVSPPDTAGFAAAGLELLEAPQPIQGSTSGMPESAYRLPVTAWDSGWYRVPPMTAVVNLPDGRSVKAVSPALRFRVDYPSSALRDTVEMAANRPNFEAYPMTLGERFQRQWPFWAAVLASAALVAAVWWLRRRRLRGTVDPRLSVVRAARSPFETALAALDGLRASADWTKGRVTDHYMSLSLILREYLEARFEVPALESTTDLLPGLLQSVGVLPERLEALMSFARSADLVKFAKFSPDVLECENALERVRQLIVDLESDAQPQAPATGTPA